MFAFSIAQRKLFDARSQGWNRRASGPPRAGPVLSSPTFSRRRQVVVGFPDDHTAVQATQALVERGIEPGNVDRYPDSERHRMLAHVLASRSGSANVDRERARARNYLELAEPGCGWLVVDVADSATTREVMSVAACLGATTGWLSEDRP
jgi:hypothetical protein